MTLRQKLVIAFATVAVVVAALVGGFTYGLTAHNLRIEVDRSLATAATTLSAPGTLPLVTAPAAAADQQVAAPTPGAFIQTARVIASDGAVSQLLGLDVGLPVSTADQSLASSGSAGSRQYEDVTVGDRSSRVLTQSLGSVGGAIQVARELSETSRVLGTLAFTIAVVGLLVLLVAAFAGWLVARQITRRLTGLTEVVERVSSTGHLDVEIPAGGRDEVGRLSTSLQAMLAELARSRDDQHRLLQNAGHELRTPLTSLRTNVSVMRRFDELSPPRSAVALDDVDGETRELTNLVNQCLGTQRLGEEPPIPVGGDLHPAVGVRDRGVAADPLFQGSHRVGQHHRIRCPWTDRERRCGPVSANTWSGSWSCNNAARCTRSLARPAGGSAELATARASHLAPATALRTAAIARRA